MYVIIMFFIICYDIFLCCNFTMHKEVKLEYENMCICYVCHVFLCIINVEYVYLICQSCVFYEL